MSEVDTVWTWGGQTSTPPISKYLIKKSGWYGILNHSESMWNNFFTAILKIGVDVCPPHVQTGPDIFKDRFVDVNFWTNNIAMMK